MLFVLRNAPNKRNMLGIFARPGAMGYSVKEIFYTLQGEGANSGRPAVFLRFAGCNLWSGREPDRATAVCRFCDTEFVGTDGAGGGKFETPEALAAAVEAMWPAPGAAWPAPGTASPAPGRRGRPGKRGPHPAQRGPRRSPAGSAVALRRLHRRRAAAAARFRSGRGFARARIRGSQWKPTARSRRPRANCG